MNRIIDFSNASSNAKRLEIKEALQDRCWRDECDVYHFTIDPANFRTRAEFEQCVKQFLFLEELYNENGL